MNTENSTNPAPANIARVKGILKGTTTAPTSTLITVPGIYRIPEAQYHADPVQPMSLSRGNLADMLELPAIKAKIRHPRYAVPEMEDSDDAKFDIGTAAHSLFLEGIDAAVVCDFKDWRTGKAKEERDDARLCNKVPLLLHQYKNVCAMVDAAHLQLAASELGISNLHEQGDSEMTYIWKEGATFFRVRPDWISHKKIAGDRKLILDYKTTGKSADPNAFKASDHGKAIQHSLYRRGVKAVEGGNAPRFVFFTQETEYPYLCSVVGLDPQTIEMAKQQVDYSIFMWEQCLALDQWPGYPTRVCYVESKPWEVAAWEMKAANIGQEE